MFLLALAAAVAAPQPGALKTFGDWAVGCDNGRACQAVALLHLDDDDRDAQLFLVLTRDGDAAAAPTLRVPLDGVARGTTVTLAIDGKPVARLVAPGGDGGLRLPFDRKLYAALGQGRSATLTGGGRPRSASLTGATAAMLYIDDQQHRLGTRDALIRVGPATAVPAPPPLPVVAQPAPGTRPPRALSVKDAMRLIGPDNTRCHDRPLTREAARLDATHGLALVNHPCDAGAYNLYSSVFIVPDRGPVMPASFDAETGMGEQEANEITNARWDATTRRLTDYVKARGAADCGTLSEFAWDGTRFRLVRQQVMSECRGSTDWITIWRARVDMR